MKKRIISVLLIAVLLCGAVMGSMISSHAAELYGDVDGDDDVTIIDVTMIQRHLAGVIRLDEAAQRRGDVDADEDMTVIDATLIQRYLSGIIDKFPAGETLPTQEPIIEPTQAPTEAPTQAPTEADDEVTKVKNIIPIHFTNNKNWSKVNAYLYNSETSAQLKAWPGTQLTNYTTNNLGEKIYSMDVDVTQYDRVIFNNGTDQTTDLPVTKASSGYFIDPNNKGKAYSGKYLTGLYPYGQDKEGTLQTVSFTYPDGNYKKNVYVWLPEGYDANDKSKKYSVLYMCDGQNLFGQATTLSGYEWECDESVLSLMQNGGDGVIVVGIACGDTEARRNHELTPNLGQLAPIVSSDTSYQNGGGKAFSDFVTDTVIPYVEKNYNTNSIRGIAGSSSGGIEAFYIGMENMDKFRYIGALSPAFILYNKSVWDTYLNTKDFSGDVPRIYFFCGNSTQDQLEQALYTNATAMEGWMKAHGYPADRMITKTDADAVHNEGFWALYFPEMLSWCMDL
ncbi:MAG: starch-binding protein [Ruminococcus sp.]|nr:starch-binding protein [Ruminococcus sp.]MBQ1897605.1 starch-binding protein [Ruminococcus sp.]MBQ4237674.1 starch-binding protein [Ruminococcus sp.]